MDTNCLFSRAMVCCVLFSPLLSRGIDVPGVANPWLAGMPDGSTASGDTAPQESPVLFTGFAPGDRLQFRATGSAGYSAGVETGPDGTQGFPVNHGVENGIGEIDGSPANALIGVFLDNTQPDTQGAPPDPLNFTTDESRDFSTLTPALRQPFFIGDGLTSSGGVQSIVVPAGATRLFLGITDGSGWYNNSGAFSVTVSSGPSLSIRHSGGNAEVRWASNAGNYALEATTDLINPTWTTVSTAPTVDGADNVVTEPLSGNAKFYRLHLRP